MKDSLNQLLAILTPGSYAYDILSKCLTRSELLVSVSGLMPNLVSEVPDLKVLQKWLNGSFSRHMLASAGIFVQPEALPNAVDGRFQVLCADRNENRLIHPKNALGMYYGKAELYASSGQVSLYNNCMVYAENTHVSCCNDSRASLLHNCHAQLGDFSRCIAADNNEVLLTNYASVTTERIKEGQTNTIHAKGFSTVNLNTQGNRVVANGMPMIFDWHAHAIDFVKSGLLYQPFGKAKQVTNPAVISVFDKEACAYLREYASRRDELRHQPHISLAERMPSDILVEYRKADCDERRIEVILRHFDQLAAQGLRGRELEAEFSADLLSSHQVYTNQSIPPIETKGDYYVLGDTMYTQTSAQGHGHFADCAVGCVEAGTIESLGHSLAVAMKSGKAYGEHLLVGLEQGEIVCFGRSKAVALGESSAKASEVAYVEAAQHATVTADGHTISHLKGEAHGEFSGEASFVAEERSSYVCKERAKGCKVIPYMNPYLHDNAKKEESPHWGVPTGVAERPGSVTKIEESAVKSMLDTYRRQQTIPEMGRYVWKR